MTFSGHFKATNEKIAYIFLTVQDRHMVTMKHYWEVDIGLSNLTLYLLKGHLKVTKVTIEFRPAEPRISVGGTLSIRPSATPAVNAQRRLR